MRERKPPNGENGGDGRQKKSQVTLHAGGRDNPFKPQQAQGDWDCFGPLLWLVERGGGKPASSAGFHLSSF